MPLYTFKCDSCNKIFDHSLTLDQLEKYKSKEEFIHCPEPFCESTDNSLVLTPLRSKHVSWSQWQV